MLHIKSSPNKGSSHEAVYYCLHREIDPKSVCGTPVGKAVINEEPVTVCRANCRRNKSFFLATNLLTFGFLPSNDDLHPPSEFQKKIWHSFRLFLN